MMMMLGRGEGNRPNPTVHIPSWSPNGGETRSSSFHPYDVLTALRRYLPSNDVVVDSEENVDAYTNDEFRMYEFKVGRCVRTRSHDWTECPYAHPGEKARRRDPRQFHYSGTPCPDFRKGNCKKGDSCEYAHGVFECWLHPARYRTQPCKDGTSCVRRVCFFAHTNEQLRVLTQLSPRGIVSTDSSTGSYGSPFRHGFDSYLSKGSVMLSSPTSTLMFPPISSPSDSPPVSPGSIDEMMFSLSHLDLNEVKPARKSSWNAGYFSSVEEEPVMERVESGRNLREKIFEKLSKENSLSRGD